MLGVVVELDSRKQGNMGTGWWARFPGDEAESFDSGLLPCCGCWRCGLRRQQRQWWWWWEYAVGGGGAEHEHAFGCVEAAEFCFGFVAAGSVAWPGGSEGRGVCDHEDGA